MTRIKACMFHSRVGVVGTLVHENSNQLSTALELSDGFAARQVHYAQKLIPFVLSFFILFFLANHVGCDRAEIVSSSIHLSNHPPENAENPSYEIISSCFNATGKRQGLATLRWTVERSQKASTVVPCVRADLRCRYDVIDLEFFVRCLVADIG